MNGLGWDAADEIIELREALASCRWWQFAKRRRLREMADELEAEAAKNGLDLGPLFGKQGQLRLGAGAPTSAEP